MNEKELRNKQSVFQAVDAIMNNDGYLNAKKLISRAYQTNQQMGKPVVEKSA